MRRDRGIEPGPAFHPLDSSPLRLHGALQAASGKMANAPKMASGDGDPVSCGDGNLAVVRSGRACAADWLTAAAVYVVFLVESVQILSEVGRILVRDVPAAVAPEGWLVLVAGASLVAAACGWWARRLAMARQGVRS